MKKIISVILVLCVCLLGVISVSAQSADVTDNTKKYLDEVYLLLMGENISENYRDYYSKMYSVVYEYSFSDEATPDYVCVFAGFDFGPAYSYGVFGDYVVRDLNCYIPYELGYYVYVPVQGAVYTLREAWDNSLPEIERAFTEGGIGELIGDVNGDGKLSIQDATEIQKYIAKVIASYEIEDEITGIREGSSEELSYISDFNRDGERNIKDATAIQKHIAGLEY